MSNPGPVTPDRLRHALLGHAAEYDVDVTVSDEGATLRGPARQEVPWATLAQAVEHCADADRVVLGHLLVRWLKARMWVARPAEMIRDELRVLGMPVSHPLHPGGGWVVEQVHGNGLHLGIGAEGIDPSQPDVALPIPSGVWQDAGVDPSRWWPRLRWRHERMGQMCALRYAAGAFGTRKIKPIGGHDVVTLLGSATLREGLADHGEAGMMSVAVPVRTEGLVMTRRVDPAFANVLASAAPMTELGFDHPVLVTRDEVVVMPPYGDVVGAALADPLPEEVLGGIPSPYFGS